MKKILIVLALLLMVGCGNKTTLNLEEVESSLNNSNLFSGNDNVKVDYLNKKYGLVTEGIKSATISMSSMLTSARMYAIFEADDVDAVKKNTDAFMKKYAASWMMGYNLEQEALVENRMVTTYGNYIIYIISEDNNKALDLIKG